MQRIAAILLAIALICAPPAFAGQLCSTQLAAPITGAALTAYSGFGAPTGITLDAHFSYGSGGTATDVWVQTSTDGGVNWWDVADFHFTTASANSYQNLTSQTAVNTA